jgi:hypothetical protein
VSFESARGIFFFAKTDVVPGVSIAGRDVQQIYGHLNSRNLWELIRSYDACAFFGTRTETILARLPAFHSSAITLAALGLSTGSPTRCHFGPGFLNETTLTSADVIFFFTLTPLVSRELHEWSWFSSWMITPSLR